MWTIYERKVSQFFRYHPCMCSLRVCKCVCVCGCTENALCRRRFTKPARAFTDGKLADGQGAVRASTVAQFVQWVTKIRAVFK